MKQIYKQLGKVRPTVEGDWSIDKTYTLLSIVYDEVGNASYISRKDVPAGIQITNKEYWTRFSNTRVNSDSIVLLSKIQDDGLINSYDLQEAIDSFKVEDRRLGTFISFYEKPIGESTDYRWNLYQFNSNNIDDWNNTKYWQSIYYIQNKFLGLFSSEESLKRTRPFPIIGDYAFVGATLKEAVVYRCNNIGTWTRTNEKAKDYLSINLKGDITISEEGNWVIDGVDTGISSKGENGKTPLLRIKDYKWQVSYDGGIIYKDIPNSPIFVKEDDEDIVGDLQTDGVKLLKFADKEYNASKFSGLGRVYLRKNIVNGKNVLTQEMINKPNTIYIIQYDYDLDNKQINIPENCTLQFEGGSFKNGVLNGSKFNINAYYKIFDNIRFVGKITKILYLDLDWFVSNYTDDIYDSVEIDSSIEINEAINSGIKNILFPNDKFYYLKHSIVINGDINLLSKQNTREFDTNYRGTTGHSPCIYSNEIITLLEYNYQSIEYKIGITIGKINFYCRKPYNNLNDKNIPILKITNIGNNTLWGLNIDANINAKDYQIPIEGYSNNLHVPNYTGLLLYAKNNAISYVKINGYIQYVYNAIIANKDTKTWFTDITINGDTRAVFGGIFNGGNPVRIFGSHQPIFASITNVNNASYFKGEWINLYGFVWDCNLKKHDNKVGTTTYPIEISKYNGFYNNELGNIQINRNNVEYKRNKINDLDYLYFNNFLDYYYTTHKNQFLSIKYTLDNIDLLSHNDIKVYNEFNLFNTGTDNILLNMKRSSFLRYTYNSYFVVSNDNLASGSHKLFFEVTIPYKQFAYGEVNTLPFIISAFYVGVIKINLLDKSDSIIKNITHELTMQDIYYQNSYIKFYPFSNMDINTIDIDKIKLNIDITLDQLNRDTYIQLPYILICTHRTIPKQIILDKSPNLHNYICTGFTYYNRLKGKYLVNNNNEWYDYQGNPANAPKKGTTSQRPTGVQIGFTYKDTDLNKWIIWNGEAWENIDGTALG